MSDENAKPGRREGERAADAAPAVSNVPAVSDVRVASSLLGMPIRTQFLVMIPPFALAVVGALAAVAMLGAASAPIAVSLVLLAIAFTLTLTLAPTAVRVGRDGIVTRWLGRQRFIPFARVMNVTTYDVFAYGKDSRGVLLMLSDGEHLRLPTGQTDAAKATAAQLAASIVLARATTESSAHVFPLEMLARGGRTPKEWVRALRDIGAGISDLRQNAIPLDALLRVVEDSAASAADRARAAVAALASTDPVAKERVRVAAQTVASPKLRVALERLAADGRAPMSPDAEVELHALVEFDDGHDELETPTRSRAR